MSHFFAYLSRMKYINRWGIMRNTTSENIMEHSLQVAMIAHSLCAVRKNVFKLDSDVEKVLLYSVYHETSEVITGDLATPVKYFNPEIASSYKNIEKIANSKIFSMLPAEMKTDYEFLENGFDDESYRIVKAADKICAFIKCVEELKTGNDEFAKAKVAIESQINNLGMPEVDYWMKNFSHSFELTLDELN